MTDITPSPDDLLAAGGQQDEGDGELERAASVLGTMSSQATLATDIEAMVERSLSEDIALFERMKKLAKSLGLYFGDQDAATSLLFAISNGSPEMDGFDLLAEVADESARANLEMAIRRLGGLFGDEISRGLNLASRPAEDWQYINVTTRYEVETGRWLVDVVLDRFDGEQVRVYGDALSMIRLVNHLLRAINTIGQLTDSYPQTLNDDEDVATFAGEVQAIFEGLGLIANGDDAEPT